LGVSYASAFEVLLVSLALVYYASDMPDGKSNLIDYCKGVVNDSPDYQGHDQRWSPPDSWRYIRKFQLEQARQRIKDAMSRRHKGGDVQAIEYVAQHTFGVTLVANDIIDYKRRIILGPQERDGTRKPLLDPSGTSKHPKSRLVGMLPAVARTVITQFDHFDELLQQAVHLLPAEVFTEGSPAKQTLKRRVEDLEAVTHDLFEENQDLQESLEREAKKRAKEVGGKFYFQQKHFQTFLTFITLGSAA
jgi:hypothetical protein